MSEPASSATLTGTVGAWAGTGIAKYLELVGVHQWSDVAAIMA